MHAAVHDPRTVSETFTNHKGKIGCDLQKKNKCVTGSGIQNELGCQRQGVTLLARSVTTINAASRHGIAGRSKSRVV